MIDTAKQQGMKLLGSRWIVLGMLLALLPEVSTWRAMPRFGLAPLA
jgi:hypothetical protein